MDHAFATGQEVLVWPKTRRVVNTAQRPRRALFVGTEGLRIAVLLYRSYQYRVIEVSPEQVQ